MGDCCRVVTIDWSNSGIAAKAARLLGRNLTGAAVIRFDWKPELHLQLNLEAHSVKSECGMTVDEMKSLRQS